MCSGELYFRAWLLRGLGTSSLLEMQNLSPTRAPHPITEFAFKQDPQMIHMHIKVLRSSLI